MEQTQKKEPAGTIDCTPTWSGLVNYYLQLLQEDTTTPKQREAITQHFRHMAKVADMYVEYTKQQDKDIMQKIVEIARPKFCGDTNIIIGAKIKITGFTGDNADLNGLTGTTCNPFARGYNTTGMIGVILYPRQIVPGRVENSKLNVDADKVFFIE